MKKKESFVFDKTTETYVIQLKKKNYWWLLLLLIPFLLLILQIKIHKDVIFKTIDKSTAIVLPGAEVSFTYPQRNFIDFSTFKFFTFEEKNENQITDKNGLTTFKVSYTIYSKLFHSKDKSLVVATGGCFQSDTLTPFFHKLKHKKVNDIELETRSKTVSFIVIDNQDKEELPGADVEVDFYISGQKQTVKAVSDARGVVEINIIYCADSLRVNASKFGYKPYTIQNNVEFFDDVLNRTLPLEPIMTAIEFFVKDKKTKLPIPNATAKLVVDNISQTAITNTNGIGKGMFDSVAIIKKMHIEVSHPSYHDTITKTYTVEEFVKLNDEGRTVYLRPKVGNITFKNIDENTKQPLPGVKNEVFKNGSPIGEFISNNEGEFTVPGLLKSDKISIKASKPDYVSNETKVNNKKVSDLESQESRTIPLRKNLKPDNVTPPRKHCRAHFSGTLLSDTYIEGHISKIYVPDKFGEYVGEGEYPSNADAFPNAVKYTFDAIAVDAGTRVIIYSEPNFKGSVLIDVTGPALINNVKWQGDARLGDFITRTLNANFESLFPKSCRRWSESNMHTWDYGSCKIICK